VEYVYLYVYVTSTLTTKTLYYLHSVFVRYKQSSQYKNIILMCRINRLLFVMEKGSVYCEVELYFLYTIYINFTFKWL